MSDPKTNPFPAVPPPTTDPKALLASVRALTTIVEILTGRRGDGSNAAVLRKDQP